MIRERIMAGPAFPFGLSEEPMLRWSGVPIRRRSCTRIKLAKLLRENDYTFFLYTMPSPVSSCPRWETFSFLFI